MFKSHFWRIFMKFQKKLAWAGLLVYSETRLLKWTIGGMKMAKYLVIVESPAKVKTIKKFLGSNYEVAASNGHVRDFPKSSLGIDVEHDYEPKYITIRGKGEVLANLRKLVKKQIKYISQPTLTARGRRFPGICIML